MKLAIQLTSGVESEDAHTVKKLAEAALRQGHEVNIFVMDDGVHNLHALKILIDRGAHIAVCAHNAHERSIVQVEGILFGGQPDWAEIVNQADRVVCFG